MWYLFKCICIYSVYNNLNNWFMKNLLAQKEYESIRQCRVNYLNTALCQKMRGKKDKLCLNHFSTI